jgi:uncharacterized protein (TIGR03790 family)
MTCVRRLAASVAFIIACLVGLCCPASARALGPANVFLVANKDMPDSIKVAEHYCTKRGVPKEHIIQLSLPTSEDISRKEFNEKLREPLRAALKAKRDQVKVLLTVYGVPLRAGPSTPSEKEKQQLAEVQKELKAVQEEKKKLDEKIKELEEQFKKDKNEQNLQLLKTEQQKRDQKNFRIKLLEQSQHKLSHQETVACVDSELMLLWWDDYDLYKWQPNLLNFRVSEQDRAKKPPVLYASRLDGPTVAIAVRLVDDAVEVEQKGLAGTVYVDARGIGWNKKGDSGYGYGGYDESLREMAELLKEQAKLPVVLDNKPELLKSQSCPGAALYCGWYSLAKYVDCCTFNKGAVAYHIASSEAVSLRNAKSTFWCPKLLEAGVAATLGPVSEPYTIGFPKPAEFFGFLVTGKYTLAECYGKTLLLNSWMTVLVGDPLYNPYLKTPKLTLEQVQPSPKGSPWLFQLK